MCPPPIIDFPRPLIPSTMETQRMCPYRHKNIEKTIIIISVVLGRVFTVPDTLGHDIEFGNFAVMFTRTILLWSFVIKFCNIIINLKSHTRHHKFLALENNLFHQKAHKKLHNKTLLRLP